ncbi:hypothetical protein [Limobrevibacterium gyesilva]|uniref:Uncharacterized protein n=1 Tax=Limobrevibacterium gyesilva TaxID=2991712 RepID=A0AA41YTA9_9PROT|nr:hypothetical protein [Limobrevibacterium gyesilva]MCW3476168.1 hypothetical protein [Limobrevibacterium gyesilva]
MTDRKPTMAEYAELQHDQIRRLARSRGRMRAVLRRCGPAFMIAAGLACAAVVWSLVVD